MTQWQSKFKETQNVHRPAQVQNFEHEVQLRIEQTKATPTYENTHALKTTLTNLLAVLQRILEYVQFKSFATHRQMAHEQTQKAKYMPKVPENEVSRKSFCAKLQFAREILNSFWHLSRNRSGRK